MFTFGTSFSNSEIALTFDTNFPDSDCVDTTFPDSACVDCLVSQFRNQAVLTVFGVTVPKSDCVDCFVSQFQNQIVLIVWCRSSEIRLC